MSGNGRYFALLQSLAGLQFNQGVGVFAGLGFVLPVGPSRAESSRAATEGWTVVDYDAEKPLRKTLNVRSQSTVIVYKGDKQTAMVAGETEPAALQRVLKSAL